MNANDRLTALSCITEKTWSIYHKQLNEIKDYFLELQIDQETTNITKLLLKVSSVEKFNELLIKNITKISDDKEAEKLLQIATTNVTDDNQKKELEDWKMKLQIYRQILSLFAKDETFDGNYNWIGILNLIESNPSILINYLININSNLKLCYKMLKTHPINSKNEEIFKMFTEALNNKNLIPQLPLLIKIIQTSAREIVTEFFDYSLNYIHNLDSMKFILRNLCTNNLNIKKSTRYQKFRLSCKIMEHLDAEDTQLWSLTEFPLLILEQLLMNSKVEAVARIVKNLREVLDSKHSCISCSSASKNYQLGEVLVYEFDAYHKGIPISNECIDFLLKIYAAKALDFQICDPNIPSTSSDTQSINSFQALKEIPKKDKWVPDSQAKKCMCCKVSKFSLLNRRHHCRVCGSVVCNECSQKRILLPEHYSNVLVRCCEECFKSIVSEATKNLVIKIERSQIPAGNMDWKLSGDQINDQLIRDEFAFEQSPNVGLCIAIICIHTLNADFAKFLLFHCHRLEMLLRPLNGQINSEIDVVLVSKMLKYLAITSKLFCDNEESNLIIQHADMILRVVEQDPESIFSKNNFKNVTNNLSVRDIINELIKTENWKLATDLSIKLDRFSSTGIIVESAIQFIKSGQFQAARDKVSLALQMPNGISAKINEEFLIAISSTNSLALYNFQNQRTKKSSPFLKRILDFIDANVSKNILMTETKRSTSIISLNSSMKESPKINQAKSRFESIRKIANSNYDEVLPQRIKRFDVTKTHYFSESMHYLLNYGAHSDILKFFAKNNLFNHAIRYALIQAVPYDTFITYVFAPLALAGKINFFMEVIKKNDESLKLSKNYFMTICNFLEKRKAFEELCEIQMLTEDFIRAALTSIQLYLKSGNYNEMTEKTRYLGKAKSYLQTELERVELGKDEKDEQQVKLKWDTKQINSYINLITLQMEASKFLAENERSGVAIFDLMSKIFVGKISMKTLLGRPIEKNQVAILLLLTAKSIESAFGLSYRIIQECSLDSEEIYSVCIKYLSRLDDHTKLSEVEKLILCIQSNKSGNATDKATLKMCDELIKMSLQIAYDRHGKKAEKEYNCLIKHIANRSLKVESFIVTDQLKQAFVHSVSQNNIEYIKLIMNKAKNSKQIHLYRLCIRKTQQFETSGFMGESDN
jgi:zinc finger FYVE domain-containing protein 26